jgi:hypothetical protein
LGEVALAMINPANTALFIPPELKNFKLHLFDRIGVHICRRGGRTIRHDLQQLAELRDDIIPIIGCTPALRPLVQEWQKRGRRWIYWDRGYCRRVFATWLPRGTEGGYYRWHCDAFQMREIRNVPEDRWLAMRTEVGEWQRNGRHVVIAAPSRTYSKFHGIESWIADTIDTLARVTNRQLVIRDKESKRSLQQDLEGAHCLVTHGSNSAVEAIIMGYPVFVHPDSAAALVGLTDLKRIEQPIYPDRQPWLNSLAYCQYSEPELINGTLWKLMEK